VEFEFQKLLRYGPEVLGEGRGGHGMAASTPQVLDERKDEMAHRLARSFLEV
jgi:hypothetical protein